MLTSIIFNYTIFMLLKIVCVAVMVGIMIGAVIARKFWMLALLCGLCSVGGMDSIMVNGGVHDATT